MASVYSSKVGINLRIDSINPPIGPPDMDVQISGQNLLGAQRVMFGEAEAEDVRPAGPSTLRCIVPDNPPGQEVDVVAIRGNERSNPAKFRYP